MSDILKMLEMFERNHEFAPAAQRDLDEIINALRAAPAQKVCEWRQDDDVFMPGTWDGACGAKWTFTEGGPVDNEMRFCPECGGHVVLAAAQSQEEWK